MEFSDNTGETRKISLKLTHDDFVQLALNMAGLSPDPAISSQVVVSYHDWLPMGKNALAEITIQFDPDNYPSPT